jgi:hypothetical protein
MKCFSSVLALVVVGLLAGVALGDEFLQGIGDGYNMSPTNDRFYVGSDKAFIGAGMDLSGVGLSSGGSWATMISPQYFISAYHDHPGAGQTVTFYPGDTTAGGGYTFTVDSTYITTSYNGSPSDVYIGKLTTPIPAADHIASYPVLQLPNNNSYVGMTIYTYGYPNRLGENVISSVSPYTEVGEQQMGMFFNYDVPGVGLSESYLMGGDSGGPSFSVYDGQLVLMGEHFSNWGTSGLPGAPGNVWPTAGDGSWWSVDGFLPNYVGQIDASLPADQQIALVQPVPEPITMTTLALALGGLGAYLKRRKAQASRQRA